MICKKGAQITDKAVVNEGTDNPAGPNDDEEEGCPKLPHMV